MPTISGRNLGLTDTIACCSLDRCRVDVEMGFGHGMALEQGGYQFGVWQFSPTDNSHSDDR